VCSRDLNWQSGVDLAEQVVGYGVVLSHHFFCFPNPAVAVTRESRSSNAQVGAGGNVVGPGALYLYFTLLNWLNYDATF
jgi:hypothetical protein